MLQRLLVFAFGIGSLVLIIALFSEPKRELRLIVKRGHSPTKQTQNISVTTPTPTRALSISAIRKALEKAGHKRSKGFIRLGQLPSGEPLIGLADGIRPNEHRLPGKYVMFRGKDGQWRPFMGGESIYQIRKAQTGWVAALTANNELKLRSPQGKMAWKRGRVGLNPQFSPDGTSIVYIHKQSIAHHTLLRRDLNTGQERALASRGPMSDPVVSPDGKDVIYAAGVSGIVSLWRVSKDGQKTQLTNRGLQPGNGKPKGFIPPPTGRYPVLWAKHWLVYDAGEGLWAIRDDGTQAHQIVAGHHKPQWDIPGVSVVYFVQKQRTTATLPAAPTP